MNSKILHIFLLVSCGLYLSKVAVTISMPLPFDNSSQLSEESAKLAQITNLTKDSQSQGPLMMYRPFKNVHKTSEDKLLVTKNISQQLEDETKSSTKQVELLITKNSTQILADDVKNSTRKIKLMTENTSTQEDKHEEKITRRSGDQYKPEEATNPTHLMPLKHNNKFGNYDLHRWAITFGNVFMDTRFVEEARDRISINSNPIKDYYPTATMATVCINGSTIPYLEHKVMKWLDRHKYKYRHRKRPFYYDLRLEIYKAARSEECHTVEMKKWEDYQNCALLRNQRMEYKIPQYPLHQEVVEKP